MTPSQPLGFQAGWRRAGLAALLLLALTSSPASGRHPQKKKDPLADLHPAKHPKVAVAGGEGAHAGHHREKQMEMAELFARAHPPPAKPKHHEPGSSHHAGSHPHHKPKGPPTVEL
mmetsp:Transcript_44347/g.128226  ORF Transcript_44347/g.128226 Transcript_44347/m.128226 type:complete len:116 (-) Transcript_44347:200-547(-)|eukprot:CAMPEP_0176069138 /NCGR_PEP_ID=MMETSP0120_2-20121206/34517_1 /TAXON_ID=160619 /ORGANISM="Kryptoperidinium foliaceum, Strain CCMP 1326" /LENGTH=115 /DNA_ID=CAMNT_0017402767 /DNA_START=15 /DNA_END=362 /DNA_ORIENTATION=-